MVNIQLLAYKYTRSSTQSITVEVFYVESVIKKTPLYIYAVIRRF